MIYILLPAYNEEAALRQLIPDLDKTLKPLGRPYRIVVVDDGSRDGTVALLQDFAKNIPVELVRHTQNSGYGAAIKTGIFWVVQNGRPEDIAITMDADTTHSPSYIPALIQKLKDGFDMATASYTVPGGKAHGVPFKRRVFSWGANTLLRLRFHFPGVTTYTNGYRAYRVAGLQTAYQRYGDRLIEETNFSGGAELFIKTARSGAKVGEVPFELHYELRGGASKINIPRTIRCYLRLLTR